QAALAIFAEQRIAEDHVRPRVEIAQFAELVGNVLHRAHAMAGEDPMWAVRAELRAAAAGEHRDAAADWPHRDAAGERRCARRRAQTPPWKGPRAEIVEPRARNDAGQLLAREQPARRRLWLSLQDEVGVIGEELWHLRRRQPDEADLDAAPAERIGDR